MMQQGTFLGHSRLLIFCTLLTISSVPVHLASAQSNDKSKPIDDTEQPSAPAMEIREVNLRSVSTLEAIRGRIEIQLNVRAAGDTPVLLKPEDLTLTLGDRTSELISAVSEPFFKGPIEIPPGADRTGWIQFEIQHPAPTEPKMRLHWKRKNKTETIDLNEAARRSSQLTVSMMGPRDCLAVVTLNRGLDPLTTWILTEEFQKLKQRGIIRVVADLQPEKDPSSNSYSVRSALKNWLISVQSGNEASGFGFRQKIQSPVKFEHFFATSVDGSTNVRRYGSRINVFRASREHCIAAALKPVYQSLSVDETLADLRDPEAGVQRAVLEANIDRLNNEQLSELLGSLPSQPAMKQALIAENLYRVSSAMRPDSLETLVRSENAEVANAALKSLVRSIDSESSRIIRTLWSETSPGALLRLEMALAIMDARDFRHLDLLKAFAEEILHRASSNASEADENKTSTADTSKPSAPPTKPQTRSSASSSPKPTSETETLERVLKFLKQHGETDLQDVCRQQVLSIPDPVVQDVVISFLLARSSSNDDRLIHQYIAQRLPQSTSGERPDLERLIERFGPRVNQRISKTLITTIRRFPAPEYTQRLLELSKTPAIQPSVRPMAFSAALRCASGQELTQLMKTFDALDRTQKPMLLKQLALTRHDGWDDLLKSTLEKDENNLNIAMTVLRSDQSPRATEILLEFAERTRAEFEAVITRVRSEASSKDDQKTPRGETPDVGGSEPWRTNSEYRSLQRRLQIILPTLSLRTHPDSRRVLNRCHCSQDLQVSQMAYSGIVTMARSSPHWSNVVKAAKLRRDKDYEAAFKVYSEIIQRDPFYSSSYVSRASLHLRASRPDEAMNDLSRAEQLDPESPLIQSLISITDVRRGKIEEGLQRAEDILKKIPDLATLVRRDAIYNAACAYGRASERTDDPAQKAAYLEAGITHLRNSIERPSGFDEVDHALNDPDLNAFHDHPQWNSLLAKIESNGKKAP